MTSKSTTCAQQVEQTPSWMQRLKTAFDAGYYRTESSVSEQIPITLLLSMSDDCPHCGHQYSDIRRLIANSCLDVPSTNGTSHLTPEQQDELQKGNSPWWKRWFNRSGRGG
jgi:hypothetical protein